MKNIQSNFTLNDSGDILVRVKPTKEYASARKKELLDLEVFQDNNIENTNIKHDTINQCSFFFYIPSQKSALELKEYLYFDSEIDELYDIQGVSMNQGYIFFWNLGIVWSLSLKSQVMKKLSLYISEEEK
jgi:hypothetical protein